MGTVVTWVVVAVVVLVGLWVVLTYNRLVRARNAYRNGFAQIDVQLTRRHDLIPNLVEAVKGYLRHERETLEAVVTARTAAVGAQSAAKANPGDPTVMAELAGSENLLTQTLGRMMALAEAYPDLKASENMLRLSEELTSTENRVAFARQAYNDAVMGYNNQREVVPANVVAGLFGFRPAALLELDTPEARDVPRASF
jgi:LemA protein